jgi:hypothetical protein
MTTLPHMVGRQVLEVHAQASHAEALSLQRALAGINAQALVPAIAAALDQCDPGSGYLQIDRLEIDLGTLPRERLEDELPGALQRALVRAVRELGGAAAAQAAPGEGVARLQGASQRLDDVLAYFLANGTLPSSFALPQQANFEQTLLAGWAGQAQPPSAQLRAALARATARGRLARQFSGHLLNALLARLSGDPLAASKVNEFAARYATRWAIPERESRQRVWDAAFNIVREQRQAALASLLEQAFEDDAGGLAPRPSRAPAVDSRSSPAPVDSVGGAVQAHPEAAEGIFVNNAGLVLLHPFLGSLFEQLGVAGGDGLLAPDRALALLHYLWSGAQDAPEYELALPKVLCGLPLMAGPTGREQLTEVDLAAACELLEAVIEHWSALRNTSVDGLRGSFLCRPGKLRLSDTGWRLQVERSAFDILLEHLPWALSPIRLPWMRSLLWVEWQ